MRKKAYQNQMQYFIFHNNKNNEWKRTKLFSKAINYTYIISQDASFAKILSFEREFLTSIWKPST